jgi:hypothetical protein
MNLLYDMHKKQILKYLEINFACKSGYSMFPHKFLTKKNILCGIGKKTKIYPMNSYMFIHKFVFFIWGTKNVLFFENMCVQIVCSDVHATFCSNFLTF